MIVIPPLEITAARLGSSTLAEPTAAAPAWVSGTYAVGAICSRATPDTWRTYRCVLPVTSATPPELNTGYWEDVGPHEVLWAAGTNYAIDQQVIRTTTHRRYRNVIAGVDATLPEAAPTRWQDLGPTNRWAMFDQGRNLQAVSLAPVTITLLPGKRINSIALLGVEALTAKITMTSASQVVYSSEQAMSKRQTQTWSEYLFGAFGYLPTMLVTDLPPYAGATITITLQNGILPVKLSGVVMGSKIFMGNVRYNARSEVLNFSKIERDEFGNSLLVPRRTVPRTQQTIEAHKGLVNVLRDVRTELNAKPALWSWLDDNTDNEYFDAGLIYGIYKQFDIDIAYPDYALINLEAEEL